MDRKILFNYLNQLDSLKGFSGKDSDFGALIFDNLNNRVSISYNVIGEKIILAPSLVASIALIDVEKILEKYFIKTNLQFDKFTIFKQSSRIENLELRTLRTQDNLHDLSIIINDIILNDLVPFFSEFSSLNSVYLHLLTLEEQQFGRFVCSPVHPRVMIIKRLLNVNDWEEYCAACIALYKTQSNGKYKSFFGPINEFLPALVEELNSPKMDSLM